MRTSTELMRDKRLLATCPNCEKDFKLSDAVLFRADGKWPAPALARLAEMKESNRQERESLKTLKRRMTDTCAVTTQSVNFGKLLEKVVHSCEGFAFEPRDCRLLSDPIDQLVFSGMTRNGVVDSVTFLEVKSGGARLSERQEMIESAVYSGRVEFRSIGEDGKMS